MTPKEIAESAIKALDEKKGIDIKLISTKNVTVVTDYFIIVNGTSNTHVKSLADEAEDALTKLGVGFCLTTAVLLYTSSQKKREIIITSKSFGQTVLKKIFLLWSQRTEMLR